MFDLGYRAVYQKNIESAIKAKEIIEKHVNYDKNDYI